MAPFVARVDPRESGGKCGNGFPDFRCGPIRATVLVAVATAVGATSALAQEQPFDGAYRGTLECEQASGSNEVGRMPLTLMVRNGAILAFVRMLDVEGRHEDRFGSFASGPVSPDGTFRVGGVVYAGDLTFHGEYTGKLDASGGMLSGTQAWTRGTTGDAVMRSCKGNFAKIESSRP